MKKVIIFILLLFPLYGCGPGFSIYECYKAVENKFPGSKIVKLPNNKFRFLVITDDRILFVSTMGLNTDITEEEEIVKIKGWIK